jgi:hypothetical protein
MVEYLVALLAGFTAGRFGHIFGGDIMWIPHHWIFGLIIIFIGVVCIFIKKVRYFGIVIIFIGIGTFISDFRDFTLLRVWEADDVSILRFWAVD